MKPPGQPTSPGPLQRIGARLRQGGLRGLAAALFDRVAPPRPALRPAVLAATRDAVGLEIGGPSRVFSARGMLPVYAAAARIDNVNFGGETAWETGHREGGEFRFHPRRAAGQQWLREATALTGIADGAYAFVLSSHCLEHCANPLAALQEWRRAIQPRGHLLLVLPDPARTFDHRRPITTLTHLRDDLARRMGEDDRTHFDEVLALHDCRRDAGAGSPAAFRARTLANATHRCVHHHVFDLDLISACLAETGWRVLATEKARPVHLIAWARKEAV